MEFVSASRSWCRAGDDSMLDPLDASRRCIWLCASAMCFILCAILFGDFEGAANKQTFRKAEKNELFRCPITGHASMAQSQCGLIRLPMYTADGLQIVPTKLNLQRTRENQRTWLRLLLASTLAQNIWTANFQGIYICTQQKREYREWRERTAGWKCEVTLRRERTKALLTRRPALWRVCNARRKEKDAGE